MEIAKSFLFLMVLSERQHWEDKRQANESKVKGVCEIGEKGKINGLKCLCYNLRDYWVVYCVFYPSLFFL